MMSLTTLAALASLTASATALPQLGAKVNMTVPSMNNGLHGTAMKGHRWIKLPAEPELEKEFEKLGVWNTWTSGMTEAVVPPEKWAAVEHALLQDRDWVYHAEDMQEMLENDKDARRRHPYKRGMRNNEFYMAWRNLPEILDYIDFLKTLAPENMTIDDIVAGETYEGNEMPGIRVLAGPGTEPRPSFIMHGCHHSGEWITAMGMVYFIEQLITTYGIDPALTRIADAYEFDLVPVMNIDGFLFGWENDSFRTWRKTRSMHADNLAAHAACELVTPGSCENCFGTDPNRNWDVNWGGVGASDNPCSGSYYGESPFLEPEARTMADFVRERAATIYIGK
jgi:murein tripeptide amidase MpaA